MFPTSNCSSSRRSSVEATLYCPTDAHNIKKRTVIKHFKIKDAAPTCFGLQGNHHHGATAST